MTSPIWANAMLKTASKLAGENASRGRPALCDLRRATSTAYYALFHQITRHGALTAAPTATEAEISNINRWFTHTGIRQVADKVIIAKGTNAPKKEQLPFVKILRGDPTQPIPNDVIIVADAFVQLQEARHAADYSNDYDPVRYTTLLHVATADEAVKASWRLWNNATSRDGSKRYAHAVYQRFLNMALIQSGGVKAR